MFKYLNEVNRKPDLFSAYTTDQLWTDPYIAKQMLTLHLAEDNDLASRKKETIIKVIEWYKQYFNIAEMTEMCDFGCGPGLYTSLLSELGAKVTGIDFSLNSIEYARKTAKTQKLNIDYIHADYLKYTLDKVFNIVSMIYYDFCVLNYEQRSLMLDKFSQCLKDDGFLVMDVFTQKYFDQTEEKATYSFTEKDGFWSPNQHYVFDNKFKYTDEKVLLNKHTVVEEDKTRTIYNWLKCYSVEDIETLLNQHNFKIVDIFADLTGKKYDENSIEMAIVAQKK